MILALMTLSSDVPSLQIPCPHVRAMGVVDSSRIMLFEHIPDPVWRLQVRTVNLVGETIFKKEIDAQTRFEGVDGFGNVVLSRGGQASLSDAPDDNSLFVAGRWTIRSGSGYIILYRRSTPISIIRNIRPDALWATQPQTGTVSILERTQHSYSLRVVSGPKHGHERVLQIVLPSGLSTVSSFPHFGLTWVGPSHVALIARLKPTATGAVLPWDGDGFCLLLISTKTGQASIIDRYSWQLAGSGGGLDLTRHSIGSLGANGVVSLVGGVLRIYPSVLKSVSPQLPEKPTRAD